MSAKLKSVCDVIPAKAGIQYAAARKVTGFPAFAGNDGEELMVQCYQRYREQP